MGEGPGTEAWARGRLSHAWALREGRSRAQPRKAHRRPARSAQGADGERKGKKRSPRAGGSAKISPKCTKQKPICDEFRTGEAALAGGERVEPVEQQPPLPDPEEARRA